MRSADPALWDAEAPGFDEAPDHGLLDPDVRAAWRWLLLAVLPPAPADVVDLGCGTGTLSLLLAGEGYAVDAVDFSPAMVGRAEAKLSGTALATVRLGDAADPGLAPASVDVVLCRHVLWALPDPALAVARWVRVLRPGGRLVLVEGDWSTGAGLTAERCAEVVRAGRGAAPARPGPVGMGHHRPALPRARSPLTRLEVRSWCAQTCRSSRPAPASFRAVTVTARKLLTGVEASTAGRNSRVVTGRARTFTWVVAVGEIWRVLLRAPSPRAV